MLEKLLNLIFPPRCAHCLADIPATQALCAPCIATIDIHHSLGNPTVQSAIKALKFKGVRRASGHLGDLLAEYTKPIASFSNAVVVPVPLSAKRLRERGFNQAELIAARFANHFDLPVANGILTRTKHALPQSVLDSYKGRWENIKGAFAVPDPEAVKGKQILLIDDVTTSGATLFEAASILKAAVAKKIIALAIAKA